MTAQRADAAAPDAATAARDRLAEVHRLRAQVENVQGRSIDAPALPAYPVLSRVLPGGGMRPGAVYTVAPGGASVSLLLALLAPPSQSGSWCGVVGMPNLGAEAAERMGVDLSRLVMIPEPGSRWLAVTATIADVLPVVAMRAPGKVSDADAARLSARLRERDAVLIVQGAWPQAEATLSAQASGWSGVERGHGYVQARTTRVSVRSRRWATPRHADVMLPTPVGRIDAVHGDTSVTTAPDARFGARAENAPPIRAVG